MRETLELVGVGLENLAHRTGLGAREVLRLGRYPWYWRLRSTLALQEWGRPAYRVARREGPHSGLPEEDLIYGETPIVTAWDLLKRAGVCPGDRLVDLGCGRGIVLLTAGVALGCQGLGVEALPGLVERARRAAARLGCPTEFQTGDFRQGPLPEARLYLLSPTTLGPDSWAALTQRMVEAPPGSLAYTLSVPLPGTWWKQLEQVLRPYSWGWAVTYLQERRV